MYKSYIIAYNRPWCKEMASHLGEKTGKNFISVNNKNDLNEMLLNEQKPEYIFFPHWSYIIPEGIYKSHKCIIFHMTDLPYGRGGSPLQNLIIRGHKNTVISAIECVKEIDAGSVYLKKPLSLEGNAEEIFIRANKIIEEMILDILNNNPKPKPQVGRVVSFKRRKPEDGDWAKAKSLDDVYDYIRMLDAKGYPPSFVKIGNFKLEFSRASKKYDLIKADVHIRLEKK